MKLFKTGSNGHDTEGGGGKRIRWWREPLIHFFVLGLAVFGLHATLEPEPAATETDPYLVEVSPADVEWIRTMYRKRMGRQPTAMDLRAQIDQLIREQVLSREAATLGLDEGDVVVRRRLAQKMEFLFKDITGMSEPSDEDLEQFFRAYAEKYRIPPEMTFTQIYFSTDKNEPEQAKAAAEAMVADLAASEAVPPNVQSLGDASMLEPVCQQCSAPEVDARFGKDFTRALEKLTPGKWHGPVPSAYGLHAVFLHDRREATLPLFEEVRQKVANDFLAARIEEDRGKIYRELRSRYKVLVEGLPYDLDVKG